MLVFCEDCGERNSVDLPVAGLEENQYRCAECGFLNTLAAQVNQSAEITASADESLTISPDREQRPQQPEPVSKDEPPPPGPRSQPLRQRDSRARRTYNLHSDPYTKVFQKLGSQPDILGAYLYHFSDGIIAADVDKNLSDEAMTQIGQALAVCRPLGYTILQGTKEIYLVLDNQVAVSRSVTRNSILILLCNSYPLPPQLKETLSLAVNNLQAFI